MSYQESVVLAAPAAPASGATVEIFNSETAWGVGGLRLLDVALVELVFLRVSHASAIGGLKAYAKVRGDTAWYETTVPDDAGVATMPVQISAVTAAGEESERFHVTPYWAFKLEYTNSANTLTAWAVSVTAHLGSTSVQR